MHAVSTASKECLDSAVSTARTVILVRKERLVWMAPVERPGTTVATGSAYPVLKDLREIVESAAVR